MMDLLKKELVQLIKTNGASQTIEVELQPDFAVYENPQILIHRGDVIQKQTSLGIERFVVIKANHYNDETFGDHYQLELLDETEYSKQNEGHSFANISIQGVSESQISVGCQNSQNSDKTSLSDLIQAIKASEAPPEEKQKVLSQLKLFLKHPIVAAILGNSVFALLSKL